MLSHKRQRSICCSSSKCAARWHYVPGAGVIRKLVRGGIGEADRDLIVGSTPGAKQSPGALTIARRLGER